MGLFPPAMGYGEVACPTRSNRLRPKRLHYWSILLIMGVGTKDEHHTSITKGITKSRQSHTTTAAGQSTIIPPFWIRPS